MKPCCQSTSAVSSFDSIKRPASRGLRLAIGLAAAFLILGAETANAQQPKTLVKLPGTPAPELNGGIEWLNTGKPLKMADLRGKIVVLDFWTLCCINCMHIMPDLARLEEKYKDQVVFIGVHSAKFDNEKNSESIRKAILRYELKHPVVNDANKKIWDAYNVNWWPTIVVIDPEGRVVAGANGEEHFKHNSLGTTIESLIRKHRMNKTLNEQPIRFDTAKFREQADTPLYFPGKIVVDAAGGRLLIADSTHHRVVITDMDGKKLAIAGTGHPGKKSGSFDEAQFDDPQGMAIRGDTVFVADRKNNTIRRLDLKAKTVTTIAGTGRQDTNNGGSRPLMVGLNSPWDLWLDGPRLYIAMAGDHQIWMMDLKSGKIGPIAGNGNEEIKDGAFSAASFAQPSGLSSDGKFIYVADPEVSAVRRFPMDGSGGVETLVGRGLFEFGDRDGVGRSPNKAQEAQIQHAIGVAYHDNKVYVADTYNSKIKTIDLQSGQVTTFIGGPAKNGEEPVLNEPAGLYISGDTLYVADTNAHRIRLINLKTKAIKTLELKDVLPVEQAKEESKLKGSK